MRVLGLTLTSCSSSKALRAGDVSPTIEVFLRGMEASGCFSCVAEGDSELEALENVFGKVVGSRRVSLKFVWARVLEQESCEVHFDVSAILSNGDEVRVCRANAKDILSAAFLALQELMES